LGDSNDGNANANAGVAISSQFATQTQSSAPTQASEKSLQPLTIKSILCAEEPLPGSNFVIDDREVNHLTICGQIMSVNVQSAHTTYTVNDGTSDISCKVWTNDDDSSGGSDTNSVLAEDEYVKVFGRLNVYQSLRSINVFRISKITDFNEVTLHHLEVIYAHLSNKHRRAQLHKNEALNNNSNLNNGNRLSNPSTNQNMANNNNNNNIGGGNNNNMAGFAGPTLDTGANTTENELQEKILAVITANDSTDEGCHVKLVFQALPDVNIDDIRTAVDEMSTGGVLYSTIDEEHYKSTGN
jgi:replication factor A2